MFVTKKFYICLIYYYEITQNYFDKTIQEMVPIHNDNSLVSRQTYTEPNNKD